MGAQSVPQEMMHDHASIRSSSVGLARIIHLNSSGHAFPD